MQSACSAQGGRSPGRIPRSRSEPGIRQVVELGAFHLEVAAAEADVLAGEQGADDLGRFAQPLMADPGGGPATADYVLVEVLARAQDEGEPVFRQYADGGGFVCETAGW